jgi:hypothetical protein
MGLRLNPTSAMQPLLYILINIKLGTSYNNHPFLDNLHFFFDWIKVLLVNILGRRNNVIQNSAVF